MTGLAYTPDGGNPVWQDASAKNQGATVGTVAPNAKKPDEHTDIITYDSEKDANFSIISVALWRLLEAKVLTAHDLCVYYVLASFADKNGKCFPEKQTIADRGNIGYNTVTRAIDKLVKYGLVIYKTRHKDNSAEYTSSLYILPHIRDRHAARSISPAPTTDQSHTDKVEAAFCKVWERYPNKGEMGAAREAFRQLFLPSLDEETKAGRLRRLPDKLAAMLADMEANGTKARFAPKLKNWLKEEDFDFD